MHVIDHHDDLCESYLTRRNPDDNAEMFKEAEWREKPELLDREVALILVDSTGKEHLKFACHDAGNTALSGWYLLNAEHGLSSAAVKVAAVNLLSAADHHEVEIHPAIDYLADMDIPDDKDIMDERRVKIANTSMGMASPQMPSPMSSAMPPTSPMSPMPMAKGGVVKKPIIALIGEDGPEAVVPLKKKSKGSEKKASAYDYLSDAVNQWDDLDPYDRHDVAVQLVKIASESGMTVPDHIHVYSGEALNPHFTKIAQARASFTANETVQGSYVRLSKMAAALPLEDVVEAMYLLDEQAGLTGRYGSRIPDPLLSVYGTTKEAEFSWAHGGDYVTERMLRRYSGSTAFDTTAEQIFTEGLRDKFKKDPVGVFKSLPREQQILMARLASQSRETNDGGY